MKLKTRVVLFCTLSLSLLLIPGVRSSSAQEAFNIKNSSSTYDLGVTIERCDEERKRYNPDMCSGPGRVSIYRKGSTSPFQILSLKNIDLDKNQTAYNPKIDQTPRGLYGHEYSFIFSDFDFDGSEDFAICNGREGGYGGPSYDVYVYNVKSNRFVENMRLSKLTEGAYLGLFFVEPKKRQLIAHSKSGCCYHETEIYKVISGKPVLVEKIIEEASGGDTTGYDVVVTTRKLVNGKWVKRVRKQRIKEDEP